MYERKRHSAETSGNLQDLFGARCRSQRLVGRSRAARSPVFRKKNLEAQFPASHTIEFRFAERPGNTLGPVKQINVPEMRRDDAAAKGDPLIGVPVAVTENYFLVGLSRGGAEQTNATLLSQRNWMDLSILLSSGRIAKITFEKGMTGQKAVDLFLERIGSATAASMSTQPQSGIFPKISPLKRGSASAGSAFPEPRKVKTFLIHPNALQ